MFVGCPQSVMQTTRGRRKNYEPPAAVGIRFILRTSGTKTKIKYSEFLKPLLAPLFQYLTEHQVLNLKVEKEGTLMRYSKFIV